MRHGTVACYKAGCRRPDCTAAQTRAIRRNRDRRAKARRAVELRVAALIRFSLERDADWTRQFADRAMAERELRRLAARLETSANRLKHDREAA